MSTRRIVTLVAAALLFAAADAAAQNALILVRHAERQDDSTDSPLSAAGRERAERLARLLESVGVQAIYTTRYQRTVTTAEPLAKRLGLEINRDDAPTAELMRKIKDRNPKDTVLVVGHSNTVPEMLAALGHPTPITIASTEFDNLFIVVPHSGGSPTVLRLKF